MGKTRDLFKKIRDTKGTFHTTMGTIKDRMISVRFYGKPFNITVIQAYAPTSNAKEAEVEQFYKDL